ncbi:MAG: protein kinase [Synechococcales bacterium]|nr:protein kinase [Synechococcales bacterium]
MQYDPPSPLRGRRALAAIVVTDVVGFSARMSENEEHTLHLIHRDLQLMEEACRQHEGNVLKSTGDGLLMYFVSAAQAVNCAIAIQQIMGDRTTQISPQDVLIHRIGIHLGDIFFSDSDVMGNGVNIAARLQTEAEPGGICISQTVYDVVKSRLSLNAVYLGPLHLKNIQEAVPAYHISPTVASSAPPSTAPSSQLSAPSAAAAPVGEEMATGNLIHHRYRIEKVLGQGGFGRTYLARDTHRFDDRCVLKEFLPLNQSDYVVEKSRNLFEREARALYQIDHPQIPKFLAWFTQNGRLFIVQDYVDGKTYSQLLQERRQRQAAFSEAEIVQWLGDLLDVLDYLHGAGIVHRDISPDNIMLPSDGGKPVLIDFGLVKQTVSELWTRPPSDPATAGRVSPHSFVGKLGYAPTEQIRMGQCFPCSDLYALGVTAVVLLTGKEPSLLMNQGSLEWQWQSHITLGDRLTQILNRLLAEKPRDRYQAASDVLRDLVAIGSQTPDRRRSHPAPPGENRAIAPPRRPAPPPAQPAPPKAPAQGISPQLLAVSKQELTRRIGPIADYVVAEVLARSPQLSPQQWVDRLAAEIPNPQQAQEFKKAVRERLRTTPPPQSAPPPEPANPISPEFLARCRTELARCIGPIATLIMDEIMAESPATPEQLVQAIAAEIPDAAKAQEFRQTMRSGSG